MELLKSLSETFERVFLADPQTACPGLPPHVITLESPLPDLPYGDTQYAVLPMVQRHLANSTHRRIAGVICMHADAFITCGFLRLLHAHPSCILSTGWSVAASSVARVANRTDWHWFWQGPPLQKTGWAHRVVIGGADLFVVPYAYLPLFNSLAAAFDEQRIFNEIAVPSVLARIQLARSACVVGVRCTGGPVREVLPSAEAPCGHKVDLRNASVTRTLDQLYRSHARCWPQRPRHFDFWRGPTLGG